MILVWHSSLCQGASMLCLTTTRGRSTIRHGWILLRYGFQHQLGCLMFLRDATLHQNALESFQLGCLQTVCILLGILSNAGQQCYRANSTSQLQESLPKPHLHLTGDLLPCDLTPTLTEVWLILSSLILPLKQLALG